MPEEELLDFLKKQDESTILLDFLKTQKKEDELVGFLKKQKARPMPTPEELKVIEKELLTRATEEVPEYTWWEKTIAPIRSFEAGTLAAGARTAGALNKTTKALAKIINKVTGVPEEKLRGGIFGILEKDLDYYSQRAREMGVTGIAGEVAEGLGGASWDIPAIMTFGKFGLPIHGALFGAAEGGVEGAVEGAVTGAFTHKMLGVIGVLPSKARLPAFAGFGFAMTPGGVRERTAGSLTWTVLGLAGGKKKITVREFMDSYPTVQKKLDSIQAGRILKKLDPKLTDKEIKKAGGNVRALDNVYKELHHEEIRQTVKSTNTSLKQVLMGEVTPKQAIFIEELDMRIDAANKAGKRLGKRRIYNTIELAALESEVSLKEALNNADIISRRLVRSKMTLSDMMKENKYLFRYLDRVENRVVRPRAEDTKTMANTQVLRDGIPLENRPYSLPLPKGEKLVIAKQERSGGMPIYAHEAARTVFKGLEPKESRYEKVIVRRKAAGWMKNAIYTFEEYPEFKKILYDPMKITENVIAKEGKTTNSRIESWKLALRNAPETRSLKESIERISVYAVEQQRGGAGILKRMGVKRVGNLGYTEQRVYNVMRGDLESIYNQINKTRELIGLDPMPKVENYFTFFRNLEMLKEEGYNPIYEPDARLLHKKLNEVPFEFAKPRRGGKLPVSLEAFDVYKHYRTKAMKFIHKSPIIAKGRALIGEYDYTTPEGETWTMGLRHTRPMLYGILDKWLDGQIGATMKTTGVEGRLVTRALGSLNRNVAMWVLSWNFRSAFIQPTALRLTSHAIGTKWLAKGVASYMNEGKRNFCEKEANVILSRMFDVHAEEIFGMQVEKHLLSKYGRAKAEFGRVGMMPLQVLDLMAAKMTWLGAYEKAVASKKKDGLGLRKSEARIFADDIVTKTQASAAPSDIAPIQRTPWGKAASLFQTFVINEWNYLYKHVAGMGERVSTKKMSTGEKAVSIGRMVAATAVINALYEEVFHLQSPYPSPELVLKQAREEDWGTWKTAVAIGREMGETLPIIGGSIRWSSAYRTALPAIPQIGLDAWARINAILIKPKLSQYDIDMVGKIAGIPGGGQLMKFIRRRRKGMNLLESYMGAMPKPKEKIPEW